MAVSQQFRNHRRWAISQRKKAREANAKIFAAYESEQVARLAGLRQFADMAKNRPEMASAYDAVVAEIERLTRE